jgi:hypothetical protein
MRTVSGLGLAVLVATTACQTTESPQRMQSRMDSESAALRQALTGIARRYERWVSAGQADSIAAIFMEQGRQMPPNEQAAVGRAAIRDRQARLASWGTWQIHLTPEAASANGPLGIDRGTYTLSLKPGPKAPVGVGALTDDGKYLAHWHQVGGQWLMADLAWNTSRPLPRPATPAKRSRTSRRRR